MKKQIILIILILCLSVPLCSFANDAICVSVNSEDYSITISGNLGNSAANRLVTLALVAPNKSISSIDIENIPKGKTDVISDFYITTSDSEGNYEFLPFVLSSDSGDYTICVAADNSSNMQSIIKYLPSKVQIDNIVENIEKGDANAIFAELKEEETKTAVANIADISIYYSIDDNGKMKVCQKLDEKTEYQDFGEIADIIVHQALIYDIISSQSGEKLYNYLYGENSNFTTEVKGILDSILNYGEKKKLSVLTDFEKMDKETKISVLNSVAKLDKEDIEAFYDRLIISVINYEFSVVDNWSQISDYIQKYSADSLLELDYNKYRNSSYKSDIDKSLVKKSFNKTSELCTYINDFVPVNSSSSSSSGFGSQSGSPSKGKGSSSGGSSVVALPTVLGEEENKDIVDVVFDDIEGYEWANEAILYLYENNVINGTGQNKFSPEKNVTREEFIKMLVQIANITSEADCNFDDVDKSFWAYPYISKAVSAGLVNGISENEFGLGANITRQDMAVFIVRVLEDENRDISCDFTDYDNVSDYAKHHVAKAASLKIINGYEDNSFRPDKMCTRAEAAVVIYKTAMQLNK